MAGVRVVSARPRRGPDLGRRLLFLHGGSYVFEISPHHYRFCAALAEATGATVVLPIYPLAPEHDALAIQAKVRAVIAALGPFDAWLGDSAGAGLTLALAQQEVAPPPLVLLSPWLDTGLEDAALEALDARDPWLSRAGLRECGRLYAGGLEPSDPRVSPLHGDLRSIPRVTILVGTRDLLLLDSRRLRDRAPEKVSLLEYPDMVHDFMLVPGLPEARRALHDVVAALAAVSGRRGASETG